MATDQNSITAAGTSVPLPIDLNKFRGGVGILVTLSDNGSADYDVEVTGDPRGRDGFSHWNKHDILKAKSASANSNLAFPVTGVRLYARSLTGTLTISVVYAEG